MRQCGRYSGTPYATQQNTEGSCHLQRDEKKNRVQVEGVRRDPARTRASVVRMSVQSSLPGSTGTRRVRGISKEFEGDV